ncbi:MAG: alanine--glyoxylate aminotransferase family protein [Akkermansiaceae bacterium]|jgi:aspartate aminotransferase-like enzyme|nr:alanine--glyoxylate aminotransferase family protein [Akkermansiaceae bacterium]MBJ7395306.1 alanine--glyoxylate aminotransferase family protein [Akkermansiaceae bacterium]MBJ7424181.1 alanine--glyoxylate aminotransferase family protein [Akkermansiaceae bacterium]
MSYPKLFNPGPVDVSNETFAAMSQTMIGHRGKDFEDLYASTQPGLQEIFGTTRPVFISTSSAWGVMEGALRNLVRQKVLCLCCGAFSDKWIDVAKKCGFEAEAIQVEWGDAIDPEVVRAKLAEGGFDTVTFIHSETSTGVLNDLVGICQVVKSFPDTMLIVDTVSSLSTVPVNMDANHIDVMLAGVQKALALPPGMALFAVSEAGMERAKTIKNRGYYFDFIEFAKNAAVNNTPCTPPISIIFGLQHILREIAKEGFVARQARHAKTNAMIAAWGAKHGFELFAPEGRRSFALTCFKTPEGFDLSGFIKNLKSKHNFLINGGYGKIKGTTFRISNMGNETEATMQELIDAMDDVLG